jgi:hypothetical protein
MVSSEVVLDETVSKTLGAAYTQDARVSKPSDNLAVHWVHEIWHWKEVMQVARQVANEVISKHDDNGRQGQQGIERRVEKINRNCCRVFTTRAQKREFTRIRRNGEFDMDASTGGSALDQCGGDEEEDGVREKARSLEFAGSAGIFREGDESRVRYGRGRQCGRGGIGSPEVETDRETRAGWEWEQGVNSDL